MKVIQIDHRGANQLTTNHPALCERQDSHGNTNSLPPPPPVLSSPVHLPPALPAVAHRLRNPGEIPSDAPQWEPLSHPGAEEGGGKSCHLWTGPVRTPVVVIVY